MDKVFIVAEAGVNHNGSVRIAKKLIDAAAWAGCDAVKFQTFKAEDLVTIDAPKAAYQTETLGKRVSQFEMLKALELSEEDHRELNAHCRKRGIIFMSTPFDEKSADFLDKLGMKIFKISSGEITNKPLIDHIASKRKDIILSTGMSSLDEVRSAVSWIRRAWRKAGCAPKLTLLHCTSCYPTAPEDVNLRAILTLRSTFGTSVGYSDHTTGIDIPIAAAAMGATVIEKHVTLDRAGVGPDHKASTEPDMLCRMTAGIRTIEKALGNGQKEPSRGEWEMRVIARRRLVAARDIPEGASMKASDIRLKRSAKGLMPEYADALVGRIAAVGIRKDQPLERQLVCREKTSDRRRR